MTDWQVPYVESLSDNRVMKWIYLGQPASQLLRVTNRGWRQRDLVWDVFLCDLQAADLTSYEFATLDEEVEHLTSTLQKYRAERTRNANRPTVGRHIGGRRGCPAKDLSCAR